MIWVGVSSLGPPPIWTAENGQWDGQVFHSASAAAIFMGWYLPSTTPSSLPTNMLRKTAGARTASEMMAVRRKAVTELSAPHVPGGEGQHDDGPGHQRGQDHVRVGPQEHRVREEGPDVGELGLVLGVHHVAHRVLHPRVGRHDEQGRQHGGSRHEPDAGQVQLLREAIPPEDPDAQEGRLEEEGRQTLHGQWTAEDVADEAGVVRPVHPELELLDQTGHHADGHVDQQQGPEELGEPFEGRVVVLVPTGLEQRNEEGQADGDRHEEEVVDAGRGELPPGEVVVMR